MSRRARALIAVAAVIALAGAAYALWPQTHPHFCPPARIEIGSCASFHAAQCLVDRARTMTIWIADSDGIEREVVAGARVPGAPIDGGRRYDLRVPANGVVTVRSRGRDCTASTDLHVGADDRPEWYRDAQAHLERGEIAAAREMLQTHRSANEELERGLALGSLARAALREGQVDEAVRELRASELLLAHVDRPLERAADASTLALTLARRNRFAEARFALEALPPRGAEQPWEVEVELADTRAYVALQTGDSREAQEASELAQRGSLRVGDARLRARTSRHFATILAELGQYEAAIEILRHPVASDDRCQSAHNVGELGWTLLLAVEAGVAVPDPIPTLRAGLYMMQAEERCPFGPEHVANAHINLAFGYVQAGRAAEARAELEEAHRAMPSLPIWLGLWSLDLEGRVALLEERYEEALDRFAQLLGLGERVESYDAVWRASLGQARVYEARHETEPMIEAYSRAERALETRSRDLPLHGGRELFLSQREQGTRDLLYWLVETGRERDAMWIARRSRGRVLRAMFVAERVSHLPSDAHVRWDRAVAAAHEVDAQIEREIEREWTVPEERLAVARARREELEDGMRREIDRALAALPDTASAAPAPPPDEVVLVYHPSREGWLGFAQRGDSLVVRALPEIDPARSDLGATLLDPFASVLHGARRVRVLPHGVLRAVDFAALRFEGRPLVALAPVVYSLDLPAQPSAADTTALLVADPELDLRRSRAEIDSVRALLVGRGWQVRTLEGPGATREALLEELPRAALFHYAGHAQGDRWDGALTLAHGSRLEVGHVLLLPRVPSTVILSACATAGAPARAGPESASLAYAFVLSGASEVIAATRPVSDADSERIATALHRELAQRHSAAEALRALQLRDPSASAFRVIVP